MDNETYWRRKEVGLCVRCGDEPARPDRTECAKCADKKKAYARFGQSFMGSEVHVMAQLIETLQRRGNTDVLIRNKAFHSVASKFRRMRNRAEQERARKLLEGSGS